MEKIKQAIEESKRNKVTSTQVAPAITKKPVPEKQVALNEVDIVYDNTTIVKLDPKHLAKKRIVSFNKNDHLSLGFDILRTQVISKMQENGWRTMAVTSPTPGCGKTVASINLAMSIAHHTEKTAMLIDFDLRRPRVANYLGLPSSSSLNDVISDDAVIEDVLVNPGLDRLIVLPTSRPVKHSSEVLSSRKMAKMISEVRDRYAERIVIFDSSPLLGSDDAMTVLSQVDCVLVVIGNGMVTKTELSESMRYIDKNKLLGTVLNKVDSKSNHKDYYY